MSAGITYYHMQRMIAAQVPHDSYQLHLHPCWFRKDGKRIQCSELVKGLKQFKFKGSDVEFWGKALGIPLDNGIWLRVQFALHGHGLPATQNEFDSKLEAWKTFANPETHTFVAAAIGGPNMTIILVDWSKLQYHR